MHIRTKTKPRGQMNCLQTSHLVVTRHRSREQMGLFPFRGLTITAALHHFSCEDWAEGSPPNKIMILSTTQEWQFWMSLRDPARSLAWTQSISSGETWTYQTINILHQTWCFHTAKSSWHPQQWTICLTAKSQTKSLRHKQSQKCHRDLFLTSGVLQKHLQKQVFIISNSPQITFLH